MSRRDLIEDVRIDLALLLRLADPPPDRNDNPRTGPEA